MEVWYMAMILLGIVVVGDCHDEYKDRTCVGQINGSVLVVLTTDAHHPSDTDRTTIHFDAPNFIMKAYTEVRRNFSSSFTAYIPCRTAGYMTSFVQRRHPLLTEPLPLHSPIRARGACAYLEAVYLARAIKSIFLHQTSERMVLLYTDYNTAYVDALDQELTGCGVTKVTRWYFDKQVTNESLNELNASLSGDPAGFVLMADQDNDRVLTWARRRELTETKHLWIIVTDETMDQWGSRIIPGERITLVDLSKSKAEDCYTLQNTSVRLISPQRQSYAFYGMSLISESLEHTGHWSSSDGLVLRTKSMWEIKSFEGKHFTVATLPWPVFHDRQLVNGTYRWTGICIEILEAVSINLNFTYTLVIPDDKKWGAPDADGRWNGMVGMVKRGEADFSVAKFTVTKIRDSVIDYTVPFWYEPAVVVMRKPEEKSLLIYLGPFQSHVWYATFFAIPVMGAAIAGVTILRAMIYHGKAVLNRVNVFHTVYSSIWFTYGAMVQQGCFWVPSSQAIRFLVGFWWYFTLVITATYTGNLIAVLAVPKTILPVNTLNDLVDQTFYRYGVVDSSAIYSMFQLSTSNIYMQMWNDSVQHKVNLVTNHAQGLERVARENYIYLGELGGVAPVVYNNCIYAFGKEQFFPSSFAFVFPEKSPYLPFVNDRMNSLVENGMIEKWRKIYYPRDKCNRQSDAPMTDPSTIKDTQGAFILLSMGLGLGAVVLFVEGMLTIYHKCRCKRVRITPRRTQVIQELVMKSMWT